MTRRSSIELVAFGITVFLSCQLRAEDEVPSVRLPDFPTAPSPTTPSVTPPSVTLPAPRSVVVPTPTDAEPTVTLDPPTGAPTSINVVSPADTIAVPSSNSGGPVTITPTITSQPTTTAFPTVTTISPMPTSAICNICTNGTISSNDLISFDIGNISCVDASDAGLSGLIPSSNCEVLQQYVSNNNICSCINDGPTQAPSPLSYEQCNICGDGFVVTNIEGKLPILNSTEPPLNCGFVDSGGINGLLDPIICAHFTAQASNASNPCGCMKDMNTPSPAGTSAPTTEFTECFVCGNETERVTALDTIVELPDDFLEFIPDGTNSSIYTCEFIEQKGRLNTSFDRLVCSFLQMAVSDVCECQVIEPTSTPLMVPSPLSIPQPSPVSRPQPSPDTTNSTSSASLFGFDTIMVMIIPIMYALWL